MNLGEKQKSTQNIGMIFCFLLTLFVMVNAPHKALAADTTSAGKSSEEHQGAADNSVNAAVTGAVSNPNASGVANAVAACREQREDGYGPCAEQTATGMNTDPTTTFGMNTEPADNHALVMAVQK